MWLAIDPFAMLKADWPPPGAALLGGDQRQVDRVRHEIGLQQKPICSPLALK